MFPVFIRKSFAAAVCAALTALALTACGETSSAVTAELQTAAGTSVTGTNVTADTKVLEPDSTVTEAEQTDAPAGTTEPQSTAKTETTLQTEATRTDAVTGTAAGSETAASSAASSSAVTTTTAKAPEPAKHLFDELRPGMDCAAYLNAHPGFMVEAQDSCLGDGEDRIYTYPELEIVTYYENGKDTVMELHILGGSYRTREGIGIHAEAAEVEKVYGEPNEIGYSYDTPDGVLEFYLDDITEQVAMIVLFERADN